MENYTVLAYGFRGDKLRSYDKQKVVASQTVQAIDPRQAIAKATETDASCYRWSALAPFADLGPLDDVKIYGYEVLS